MRSKREGASFRARGVLAAFLSAAPCLAGAAGIAIEHSPVPCVPVDRYARIAARATGTVGRAELQFRTGGSEGWYSVRMEAGPDGEWTAFLPRPTAALRELDYRIVMTGPDAASAATTPATVRVAATCETDSPASVEATIVITVPHGAPVAPPVPAGFSPAGVVAAAEPPHRSRTMKVAGALAGAAVLGGAAAAVAGSSAESPRGPIQLPEVRFNGTSPLPGSVLAPNRDRLVIQMEVGRSEVSALGIQWLVVLSNSATGSSCLYMSGRATLLQFPTPLELTGPLIATGACGAQFDTDTVRVVISYQDRRMYEQTLALPFRFAP